MRSIFVKIVSLLILLNASLWVFVFLSDDYIDNQISEEIKMQNFYSEYYGNLVEPFITDKDISEFEKSVRIKEILSKKLLSKTTRLVVYRENLGVGLQSFKYYDSSVDRPVSAITTKFLPALSTSSRRNYELNLEKFSDKILSGIFKYYKPIIDQRAITAPIHEKKARYVPQQEVRNGRFDIYNIRSLVPIKKNRLTVGMIEISEQFSLKDAYTERNAARVNLLGGISLITLVLGVALSFSIAMPLRRLSKRLNKKLTPADITHQLESVRLKGLKRRKDEIGQLHNNLIKLTSQVAHLFNDKEKFTSEVSHELKNPIASIIAYTESFEGQDVKDPAMVHKIKLQAIRMSKLVTEISDAAIVDHDLVTQRREKLNLSIVVNDIITHYVDSKEGVNVVITSDIQSKIMMLGLPERLGQVLVNLLDNAFSFTQPAGEIRVTLSKNWRKHVTLTVEDSGPGVEPEFRSLIFERFYTSRKGSSAVKNASGLGLHICQQIIEAHSGSILVGTSDLGGAKFVLKIK